MIPKVVALSLLVGSLAFAKPCSWVGSDDSCREQETGSFCALNGRAGICAIKYWDRCECVKAPKKALVRPTTKKGKATPKCSWVGTHEACRERQVGTTCARDGHPGVCALTHWDQCDCVSATAE